MPKVENIRAREILDSRGSPTVEVDVVLEGGARGCSAVPSGASRGAHEAVELRDGGARFVGRGVSRAVSNVNTEIQAALVGREFGQSELDKTLIALDGTPDKARLGANAILGVSLAFSHAAAAQQKQELWEYFLSVANLGAAPVMPVPLVNVLNGGRHAAGSADIQEFMIVPHGAPAFGEALRWADETFMALGAILREKNLDMHTGDEGGYAPMFSSNEEGLQLLVAAVEKAGYKPGRDISLALDVASSELFENGTYLFQKENKAFDSDGVIEFLFQWAARYPIVSIEDPLAQDDWDGWKKITEKLGGKIQLVGDDLFVTAVDRIKKGIAMKAANAVLIKPNQVGTVSETLDAVRSARGAGYRYIISHRSGETEDTSIADLAVATGATQIKAGSVSRGERVSKYNRLLRIEEELGNAASYAGSKVFKF